MTVTTEQAINNAVASAEIEGFTFSANEIELCKQYAEHKISEEEFISIILADCEKYIIR